VTRPSPPHTDDVLQLEDEPLLSMHPLDAGTVAPGEAAPHGGELRLEDEPVLRWGGGQRWRPG
jgi:hypothetical protein